jgi:hypothetical protein
MTDADLDTIADLVMEILDGRPPEAFAIATEPDLGPNLALLCVVKEALCRLASRGWVIESPGAAASARRAKGLDK